MPSSVPPLRLLVLQNQHQDGPAYLATWLQAQGLPFTLRNWEAGDALPTDAADWDGLAMLGGTMSVNDPLPELARLQRLLADAVARERPVLGHCLGGQMLAKALGAAVTDNPVPEIGWSTIAVVGEHALARDWLGDAASLPVFQWHGQTFGLPPGALLLAGNAACPHQAFAFGPHLGMQFHIEVDADKLDRWQREAPVAGDPRLALPSVQDEAAMRADTARWLGRSQQVADGIYRRWITQARAARNARG